MALHAPKGKMLFRSRAIHLVIRCGKQWKKCSVKTLVGWPLAATYPHSSLLTAPFPVAWRGNRESKIEKAHGLRSGKINRWWKGGGGNLVDAKAITYTRILIACWSLRSSHFGRHVLFFLCPSSCCWAWCYIIWNTALGNLSQLWQLFSPLVACSQLTGCRRELGRLGKKKRQNISRQNISFLSTLFSCKSKTLHSRGTYEES